MELHEPIDLRKLLEKPIIFKIEQDQTIDALDEELLETETNQMDETNDKQVLSPWLKSFDELKVTMTPIPCVNDIYKRIVHDGSGDVLGRRRCRIYWSYSMFMESEENAFDSSHTSGAHVRVTLYDELMPGLWKALETMRRGEESQFIVGYKWMFGELGMFGEFQIKPKADILLVAKLVNFEEIGTEDACEKLTSEDLTDYATVKIATIEMQKKMLDHYKQKMFTQAILTSLKIIEHIQFCEINTDDERKDRNEFLANVYAKLIDCYVKLEKYAKALNKINDMRRITDVDKFVDVLVNEAIALSKTDDDFIQSIQLIRKAQTLYPNHKLVNDTLNDLQKSRNKYKNDTKNFMMKAFQTKPQPQVKKVSPASARMQSAYTDIIKSFTDIDIGSGMPLIGYTPDELKMAEESLKLTPDYKLQVTKDHDGKTCYTIKKAI